jgi:phosphoglycolate phosphatase-like HAD superfamily hydrolase
MGLTANDDLIDNSGHTWMHRLVDHYRAMRARHPGKTLAIVFDIDGTIIDTRHLIRHTLWTFDRVHGTRLFRSLDLDEIDLHEIEIDALLTKLEIAPAARESVRDFYLAHLWDHESMLAAHMPYRGVMEVIRWFQLQDHTVVVLNTGRSESMRRSTLIAMNELGREFRVVFANELLLMNDARLGQSAANAKVAALLALRERGIVVAAVVDNEPENLEAMALADAPGEALFLHASTIFLSARRPVPRSVSGERYDLEPFALGEALSGHVQLVWSDVTDRAGLRAFLGASVGWVGVPVRPDPYGRPELARSDDAVHRERELRLGDVIVAVAEAGRSLRIDLHNGGTIVEEVLQLLAESDLPPRNMWIGGEFHELAERSLRLARQRLPAATLSCPVDFLAPLVFGALEHALEVLDVLRDWGVDRLGIAWSQPRVRDFIGELERWGREVDVCGITDAESILQATLLLPRSVTASGAALASIAGNVAKAATTLRRH